MLIKSDPLSLKLAQFALNFKLEDTPREVVEYAKMLIIDAMGCAVASRNEPHATIMREVIQEMGGREQATLWGSKEKAPTVDAVIYNGGLIHGLDYDDTHSRAITHVACSVINTAMTVGEAYHKSGKEVLEAIIVGYEIIIRLGNAAKGGFHDVGFHPTGIVAPFAAVCVAGKLMGVSADVIMNAMGLCGSQAAAILEFLHDGTWSKKMHPGWAVHSALYSLAFASKGYLGPREVLEGDFGFFKTHLRKIDGLTAAFDNLGKAWLITETTYKFYPTCHYTHSAVDILFNLMEREGFTYRDINEITCILEPRGASAVAEPKAAKIHPDTDYQMRFSIYYALAVASVTGKLTPKEIDLRYLENPAVASMIEKVNVNVTPAAEVPGHFPGHLQVKLVDGRFFDEAQPYEKGCKENPATKEDVLRKYRANVADVIGNENANKLVELVAGFDELDTIDRVIALMTV
jgi:2-methylcitrate dehydratase PrpD